MSRFMFALLAAILVSEEELRFVPVYKQGYDTSCGISAAATLLAVYWGVPVSEADMYQDMILDRLSEEEINYTISMLTIMEYLKKHDLASQAYRMDWAALADTLQKGYSPILVHYEEPRPHFALLLGIEKNYAVVADPAFGMQLVSRAAFVRNYSGNALLTASRSLSKNTGYIQGVVDHETKRLDALEKLAARRRFSLGSAVR
jgi:predicted double-glycine peptidase